MSLVEILVVVAIVAALLALLIPAVMEARKAADRAGCVSHLQQVQIATASFHDTFNAYPAYFKVTGKQLGHGNAPHHYSVFAQILPYLDQTSLFNQINFQAELADDVSAAWKVPDDLHFQSPANCTVMTTGLSVLFCSADPASTTDPLSPKGSNYRANFGISTGYGSSNQNQCGPFTFWTTASARDVVDGLSHTAAYSEKPRGDPRRREFVGFVDPLIDPLNVDPPAQFLFEHCARQPIGFTNYRTSTGINWLVGGLTQTCYNHMEVPNGPVPDCLKLGYSAGKVRSTARSYHAPGANVALVDGSVRFVAATIHLATWKALATRGGGEIIPDESW